ncbi:MAG TPA: DedA family protein/thiosulfate sulfurtransferase GlpE [Steroidobacteraceae bacterium]
MSQAMEMIAGGWGLLLVFLNVLIEQAGVPIPAAPTLLLAGALAVGQPKWGVAAFLLSATACTISDATWYCAGRIFGTRIMRLICKVSLSPDSCVSDTQLRFERWGVKALVFAKFVPGLSMIAPPLAGALRMRLSLFLRMTCLGSALWIASLMGLGALAAPQIMALLPRVVDLGARAALVIGLLLLLYILLKWFERRRLYSALRMARVDPQELHSMLQGERAPTILDVRSRSALALDPRTIPGALHVPPEELATLLASISHDGEVVAYCNCPNEASAAQVARLLMQHGVTRVRPLHGGLDAWVAAGYPVSGPAPGAEIAPGLAQL